MTGTSVSAIITFRIFKSAKVRKNRNHIVQHSYAAKKLASISIIMDAVSRMTAF